MTSREAKKRESRRSRTSASTTIRKDALYTTHGKRRGHVLHITHEKQSSARAGGGGGAQTSRRATAAAPRATLETSETWSSPVRPRRTWTTAPYSRTWFKGEQAGEFNEQRQWPRRTWTTAPYSRTCTGRKGAKTRWAPSDAHTSHRHRPSLPPFPYQHVAPPPAPLPPTSAPRLTVWSMQHFWSLAQDSWAWACAGAGRLAAARR